MKKIIKTNDSQASDLLTDFTGSANDDSMVELLPYLMNRLTTKINKLWLNQIREYGLTIPRWQVLSILSAMDGSRIGTLAEMCGLEQAVISRVVDQMQRDGLVERRPAKLDSRAVEVWISEKGRTVHGQLFPLAKSYVDSLVADFSDEEAVRLANSIAKMLHHLDDNSQ